MGDFDGYQARHPLLLGAEHDRTRLGVKLHSELFFPRRFPNIRHDSWEGSASHAHDALRVQ